MGKAPPLEGLSVLDIASFIAGPAAATVLGDFGADVVKHNPRAEHLGSASGGLVHRAAAFGDLYRRLVLPGLDSQTRERAAVILGETEGAS